MMLETAERTREVCLRGHVVPAGLFIGGNWHMTDAQLNVIDPATGKALASVADADATNASAALESAVRAQADWASWTPRRRADLFHDAYDLLCGQRDAFADIMVLESGKPRAEALGEFDLSAGFFRWYAEQIAHLHGTYGGASGGGYRIITTHQPVGPCLLITPWNFPLLMIARKAGAALAAGCTAIVKSAQETPLTAALFVQLLARAGFPPGVVNLLHTSRSATLSASLMADSRLRKISFTGSTPVGSALLRQAADHIMNSSMELGGDGPFIVLDDADIDLAVEQALLCKFRNAGQACVAANRIIVHEDVASAFTEKFVAGAARLRVGNGFNDEVDVGPIISEAQRDRVVALVERLLAQGAELLLGGKARSGEGFFYEPTVLRMARLHTCFSEELFAPVATIYTAANIGDALAQANDTRYGLAAYVFTRDLSRAFAIAERLEFGMVGINRGIMADPAAAFGGVKASGMGREGGHDGIHEFLEPQYLAVTVDDVGALR